MKMNEQVLSRKQMAHLRELGIDTSDASLCWDWSDEDGGWVLGFMNPLLQEISNPPYGEGPFPAYTTGDLFRKLPSSLKCDYLDYWIAIRSDGSDDPLISASYEFEYNDIKGKQVGDTIEKALYNLLCWVAINRKELLGIKK